MESLSTWPKFGPKCHAKLLLSNLKIRTCICTYIKYFKYSLNTHKKRGGCSESK